MGLGGEGEGEGEGRGGYEMGWDGKGGLGRREELGVFWRGG